jgi:uncharacterized membrane protein YphA (DoxX/SURF4 family)
MGTYAADLQTLSVGLLLARVVVGLIMAGHGAQKLFGWFGGYGVRKTGEFFAQLGFQPGTAFALAIGVVGGFATLALRRRPAVTAQA